jgi:cytochrome c-type biogenesis protein CcmH
MKRRLAGSMSRITLLGLMLLLLALPLSATAQDGGPTDDQVNAIAKDLYCPVCENIPLDVCGTQACVQWRGLIRERLEQGWTEQQIKDYFVAQYGDRVLATPPARGLNWLVYILPPLAIVAGAFVLFQLTRSWRQASNTAGPVDQTAGSSDDPYVLQLEQQLADRHGEKSANPANMSDEVEHD